MDQATQSTPTAKDPLSRVLDVLRTRAWLRRTLSLASVGLLGLAVVMLGYPFYTNLYASREQSRLASQLESEEFGEAYQAGQVNEGDALTRIRIPAIGVDTVVVEGTTASALRAGAGHYPGTPLPCTRGANVGIAGHRTTYGRPFHDVDRLKTGDLIQLETPIGTCTYRIEKEPYLVLPTALDVVAPIRDPATSLVSTDGFLTLTTCHPKHSARQRMIIHAVLVSGQDDQPPTAQA